MTSEIKQIKTVYKGLQSLYGIYLPKVDPVLIDDLLMRQQQKNPDTAPFYMVEAFTKPGADSKRNIIFERTGMIPAVYDNGTHYAVNHRLTLEMLKGISDDEDVVEVTGEYTGSVGGWGASHERKQNSMYDIPKNNNDNYPSGLSSTTQLQQPVEREREQKTIDKLLEIKMVYKGLQTLFNTYLPKADPVLIHDLIMREQQNTNVVPFYMVEIFTNPGINSEIMRNMIIEKTGMVPAIYDKGTHYATNHRLTLEILKEISDLEYVIEVTGEYTDGITGRGASHEHLDMNNYF